MRSDYLESQIKSRLKSLDKVFRNYPNILKKFEADSFLSESVGLVSRIIRKELSFTLEGTLNSIKRNRAFKVAKRVHLFLQHEYAHLQGKPKIHIHPHHR